MRSPKRRRSDAWWRGCNGCTRTIRSCFGTVSACSKRLRARTVRPTRKGRERLARRPTDAGGETELVERKWWNNDRTMENLMNRIPIACAALSLILFGSVGAQAQEMPASYKQVLDTLGKTGDFKDNVLKVNIPRSDVSVTVANIKTPTPFGFGGWVAMTKGTGGMDVMMGDLVLTQDEVNPVMSALLDNGIDVTAVHNHFFWDEPRMFYMHVHAQGKPADLARKVKPALDLIGKGASRPAAAAATPAAASATTIDTAKLAQIVGTPGEQSGAVYKITIGRDDLKLTEMGATINAR